MSDESKQNLILSRKLIRKITTKGVVGAIDLEKLFEYGKTHGKDAVMPLFRIIGKASAFSAGQTDYGPYVKLMGQFKAVNTETGEEFRSGAAILPGAAGDLVFGALRGLGDDGGVVEFAFEIGVQRDDTVATKYVFSVNQLYQRDEPDGLAALENKLASAPPQLQNKPDGRDSKKK